MKKVILTDIDGVLLDWFASFIDFMNNNYNKFESSEFKEKLNNDEEFENALKKYGNPRKIIIDYNNSEYLKKLPYYEDAKQVIDELKDRYIFIGITAAGSNKDIITKRQYNLDLHFPKIFEEVYYVEPNESKNQHIEALNKKYENRIVCFIDDLAYNLNNAYPINHKIKQVFLNRFNSNFKPTVPHIEHKNWYEIKENLLI